MFSTEALPRLINGINGKLAGGKENVSEEDRSPLDNFISTVCKIIKHASPLLGDNRDSLLSTWLTWLPVALDKAESTVVYGFIVELIER